MITPRRTLFFFVPAAIFTAAVGCGSHEAEHREADSDAVSRASVYVDSRQGALKEAGDLLIPIAEGRFSSDHLLRAGAADHHRGRACSSPRASGDL